MPRTTRKKQSRQAKGWAIQNLETKELIEIQEPKGVTGYVIDVYRTRRGATDKIKELAEPSRWKAVKVVVNVGVTK